MTLTKGPAVEKRKVEVWVAPYVVVVLRKYNRAPVSVVGVPNVDRKACQLDPN